MRRRSARAFVMAAACVGVLASTGVVFAGWNTPVAVSGVPRDVEVWDAGQITVSTPTGGYELVNGTQTTRSNVGANAVSTFVDDTNCVTTIDTGGTIKTTGCGANNTSTSLGATVGRVRTLNGGYAYGCSADGAGTAHVGASSNAGKTNWVLVPPALTGPILCGAVSALQNGIDSYGLEAFDFGSNLKLMHNGTLAASATLGSNLPLDTALIGDATTGMRAFAIDSTGKLYQSTVNGGLGGFTQVPLPPGVTFQSLAMYQTATERFGMAVAKVSGNVVLYSAVPIPSPTEFGTVWQASTAPPAGFAGTVKQVSCRGAAECAAITTVGTGANVVPYVNASAPGQSGSSGTTVAPGGSVSVSPPADPDGDAVYVSLGAQNGVTATFDGGTVTVTDIPTLQCDGGEPRSFTYTVSDGKAGHDTPSTINFTVLRTTPPESPTVSPTTLSLTAGGPAQTVAASLSTNDCSNFVLVWDPPLTQQGVTVVPNVSGTSATVTPPINQCVTSLPASFTVRETSPDYGTSAPAQLAVSVSGFGPPLVPFADHSVQQPGGTTQTYAAEATHVCNDGGMNPVAVDTRWFFDGGAPQFATLTPDPANGVVSPGITVTSPDECHDESFQLVAQNESAGFNSPQATLTVNVQSNIIPLDAGTFVIDGGFSGTGDLVGLNCLADRMLKATYVVESNGKQLDSAVFDVPGTWELHPIASCGDATSTQVHAEVVGAPFLQSNMLTVPLPAGEPGIGTLDAGTFVATCVEDAPGGPVVSAQGSFHHEQGFAGCAEQMVQWSHASGPDFTATPAGPADVSVDAQAARWDDLVDQEIGVSAIAVAGSRQSPPVTTSAHVGVKDTFVNATLVSDAPVAEEGGVIGLTATLENTTGCPVDSARWEVTLNGFSPFGEFANVSGVRAPVRSDGDKIVVDGVALPAHGRVQITVSARANLLTRATASGRLFLGDDTPEPISNVAALNAPGQGVPETGCGCSTVDAPALIAAMAAALSLMARRRRRQRS